MLKHIQNFFLYKGEIANNISINNAKTFLVTPDGGKKTNLNGINDIIYGSAIFCDNSQLEIFDDFTIQNNTSKLNVTLNIGTNCFVKSNVTTAIRGGQIYAITSTIKINGGIIKNSNNIRKIDSKIEPENIGLSTIIQGGGMQILQCKDFEIKNLKIMKCNGDFGGGLHIVSSNGIISNTEISNNIAEQYGGAIFTDQNSAIELYNTKIMNNSAQNYSGGGIFNYGELIISGENNSICNNNAGSSGGGILDKGKITINNCRIYKNKAIKFSGGGIFADGELILKNAKIYDNWCNYYGGGLYYSSEKGFIYNQDIDINDIIYNNKAGINGDNIYPLIN